MEPASEPTRIAPTQIDPRSSPPTAPASVLPPEVAALAADPGRRVGKYVLVRPLGRGGMGEVVLAWDQELQRWVALKFLTAAADDRARAWFLREARLAARLSHPNIAAVYDAGEHDGKPWIAMQFVDGENLHAARRRMSLAQAVDAVRKVAGALEVAHASGIIHRDLKPSNVMVDAAGRVYVMDFGLAKEASPDGASLGGSGAIVGTPGYMSPEQARGRAGPASDLYSLGATLYDLVTGRAPFVGETVAGVMEQIFSADPAWPRALNPSTPRDLEAIIVRCLEKDPARRYATAGELIADLDAYAKGDLLVHAARPGWGYRLARRVRRQPLLWGLSAALVLAVAGGSAFGAWGLVRAAREAGDRERVQREERARADAERDAARRRLGEVYLEKGRQAMDRGDVAAAALYYAESDDIHSSSIARANAADALAAPLHLVAELPGPAGVLLGFSPDGKFLLTSRGAGGADLWEAATGERRFALPARAHPETKAGFSPDGRHLFTMNVSKSVGPGSPTQAWIVDLATGKDVAPPLDCSGAAFSADGTRFLTWGAERTLRIRELPSLRDAGSVPLPQTPKRVLETPDTWISFQEDGIAFVPKAAPDAALTLAGLSGDENLASLDPKGTRLLTTAGTQVQLWRIDPPAPRGAPWRFDAEVVAARFSDDGSRVRILLKSGAILEVDPDSGRGAEDARGLLPPGVYGDVHPGRGQAANFPEGDTGARLFLHGRILVLPHPGHANLALFSPAGDRLAVGSGGSATRLWELPGDWRPGTRIAGRSDLLKSALHPDGMQVATASRDGSLRTWTPGGEPLKTWPPTGTRPQLLQYSPDGTRLLFTDSKGQGRLLEVATGKASEFEQDEPVVRAWFSRDGTRLATAGKGTLVLRDGRTGAAVPLAAPDFHGVKRLAFDADLRTLAVARDKSITVFDLATAKPRFPDLVAGAEAQFVTLSPDGTLLIAGFEGEVLRTWDARTGRPDPLPPFPGFGQASFDPGGSRLAVGNAAGEIRTWELASRTTLGPGCSLGSEGRLHLLDRWVVSIHAADVRLWDPATGEPLGAPLPLPDLPKEVHLAARAPALLVLGQDGVLHRWDLRRFGEVRPGAELKHLAEGRYGVRLVDGIRVELAR